MNHLRPTLFVRSGSALTLAVSLYTVSSSPRADVPAPPTASPAAESKPSIESRTLSNIRQLTSGYTKAGEGYFSPDGRTIIYQAIADPYPFYQIYSQSLAGGKAKLLSTGRGKTTCSFFSPDGHGILYASSHLDPDLDRTEDAGRKQAAEDAKSGKHRRYQWDFDPNMEIFSADLDGKNLHRLTYSKGYDAECSYSADGRQIVFCSDRGGNPNLYTMNADGGNVRQLTHATGYKGGPFFSPEGSCIFFRSYRKNDDYLQLYVIRPTARARRRSPTTRASTGPPTGIPASPTSSGPRPTTPTPGPRPTSTSG